jgi:hypothetical protein
MIFLFFAGILYLIFHKQIHGLILAAVVLVGAFFLEVFASLIGAEKRDPPLQVAPECRQQRVYPPPDPRTRI